MLHSNKKNLVHCSFCNMIYYAKGFIFGVQSESKKYRKNSFSVLNMTFCENRNYVSN